MHGSQGRIVDRAGCEQAGSDGLVPLAGCDVRGGREQPGWLSYAAARSDDTRLCQIAQLLAGTGPFPYNP